MAVELPDPDLSVSFVVDDGEAVGPLTLREIARSIAAGERPDDSYVWWSGAGEWVRFRAHEELIAIDREAPEPEPEPEVAPEPELAPEPEPQVNAQPDLDLTEPQPQPQPQTVTIAEIADEPLEEISLSDRSVLADVGARLEALASATRHVHTTSQLQAASSAPALRLLEGDSGVDLRDPERPISDVRASALEADFASMVRRTESRSRLLEQGDRVRELLARACGAAMSRQGYAVERRNRSDGSYFLGFERGVDGQRMSLEISPSASVGGASGHHVHLALSWGRPVDELDDALTVIGAQLPVADRPLGVISSDAQIDTGLISTRVELIWSIDDYIDPEFTVDSDGLENGLNAIQRALETRWNELFTAAE